ncbi:interleukin-31 receptor subunit alpha [Scomber japonicus]|uniref:interleukin-31 receptor subunit alpha n=1 Tax=Scomber japonicus TaxID=13676 RepID=UPI0023059CEA|nr:interleukin-31 receptor subunit alpha [Scomber japonicus]
MVVMKCKSKNISSIYQHCRFHPDGVHDLDCFGKYSSLSKKTWTCEWKPGNHSVKQTYTLIVRQEKTNSCKEYKNVTGISSEVILYERLNMIAEVFENSESTNCTKALFRGSPLTLLRCGPPYNATFSRHSGRLYVNVSWQKDYFIDNYSVRYKAMGSLLWSKSSINCTKAERCTVENLNTSQVYVVQIQCVTNAKCLQCPWSDTYTVSSELTTQPLIINLKEDIAEGKGHRLLSLTWKFAENEQHNGYLVTIWKASGEATTQQMMTTRPEIRLTLSYSAYHLNISAFNNASVSPAVNHTIPQKEGTHNLEAGKLNVTVHDNTTFTIYWKDDLIKKYVCYCVEWKTKEHETAAYMSFYQDAENQRILSGLTEPLEPYKRYSITLHIRSNKDTCNIKYINNSESTYGTTQFYFIEGSPVKAPTNISSYSVMLDSVGLQWSTIPEEDIRGFLLGYIIHYIEYQYRETHLEKNITVDPEFNSYKLEDLKSGTAYQAQISAFTQAGAGGRSAAIVFRTNHQDFSLGSFITVFAVLVTVLIFGTPIIKRTKHILWPSIPNPGNSNTMQKIDGPFELEVLEAINILKVEEGDTDSLHVVEKEAVIPESTLQSTLPLLHHCEDEEELPEMTLDDWIQRDNDDDTGDDIPRVPADTLSETQRTNLQSSPFAFSSEYTTMELFQQAMPQGTPANTSVTEDMESEPEDIDFTVVRSDLDYVRQFSTSPVEDWNVTDEVITVF